MNTDVKAKWIEALRSGEFDQVDGYLNKDDSGFCCLGVLCELAVEDGVVQKRQVPTSSTGVMEYFDPENDEEDYEAYNLPSKVMDWAGLTSENPEVTYTHDDVKTQYSLAELNDGVRLSFEQIADQIEEKL